MSSRLRNQNRVPSRRVSTARRSRIQERIDQAREAAAANSVEREDIQIDTEDTYRGRDNTTLTRREHLAFSPIADRGDHRRDQLSENVLKDIRAKIRAEAYVGTCTHIHYYLLTRKSLEQTRARTFKP